MRAEILERSHTIGSAWRTRYDCLRLNTCRWNSTLSRAPYPKGTPVFPPRDDYIRYLESYAERHGLAVELGVQVKRIDRHDDGWCLSTSSGERMARHVIIATGYKSVPWRPDWPGLDRYPGRLLHSAEYRNAEPFRGRDVLVIGAGSSAMDIASDLANGDAGRVRVAVRTQPNLTRRAPFFIPADLIASALFRVPAPTADRADRLIRRVTIGDLTALGLTIPDEGSFTRTRRTGSSPTVVGRKFLRALKSGRIEIITGVASVDADGVLLDDGSALRPDAVITATGFTSGLAELAGHLGVLDDRGLPLASGGPAAAPGLRFTGYVANIRSQYKEALRVAEQVALEEQRPPEEDVMLPPVSAHSRLRLSGRSAGAELLRGAGVGGGPLVPAGQLQLLVGQHLARHGAVGQQVLLGLRPDLAELLVHRPEQEHQDDAHPRHDEEAEQARLHVVDGRRAIRGAARQDGARMDKSGARARRSVGRVDHERVTLSLMPSKRSSSGSSVSTSDLAR